jgi:hypothetical protein
VHALDKIPRLAARRHQRQQILDLLDTFSKFTDRSLLQMGRLRTRFFEVSEAQEKSDAANLLANSTNRLRALGEKAVLLQRSLQAAAATTDELLSFPERLAENLDDETIDRALAASLRSVERARSDLQEQILEIDAISDEVDRLLNQHRMAS